MDLKSKQQFVTCIFIFNLVDGLYVGIVFSCGPVVNLVLFYTIQTIRIVLLYLDLGHSYRQIGH